MTLALLLLELFESWRCGLSYRFTHAYTLAGAVANNDNEYVDTLKALCSFWSTHAQRDVTVTWNPKAPGAVLLTMNVFLQANDDSVHVFSKVDESGYDFAAAFYKDRITIADNNTLTIASLPPIPPSTAGTATGHPAHLIASRTVILVNSVPRLQALLGRATRKQLSTAQERQLGQELYANDRIGVDVVDPKKTSFLEVSKEQDLTRFEWRDVGGVIFGAVVKAHKEDLIALRAREFDWVKESFKPIDCPKLVDVAAHLVEQGVVEKLDGEVVSFSRNGAAVNPRELKPTDVMMEMVRIRVDGKVGTLVIARCAPLRSKSVQDIRDTHGKVIGRVCDSLEVAETRVFAVRGQSWMMTVTWPGFTDKRAGGEKLTGKLIEYIVTRASEIQAPKP